MMTCPNFQEIGTRLSSAFHLRRFCLKVFEPPFDNGARNAVCVLGEVLDGLLYSGIPGSIGSQVCLAFKSGIIALRPCEQERVGMNGVLFGDGESP